MTFLTPEEAQRILPPMSAERADEVIRGASKKLLELAGEELAFGLDDEVNRIRLGRALLSQVESGTTRFPISAYAEIYRRASETLTQMTQGE